jgi:hypothetical protein
MSMNDAHQLPASTAWSEHYFEVPKPAQLQLMQGASAVATGVRRSAAPHDWSDESSSAQLARRLLLLGTLVHQTNGEFLENRSVGDSSP